ncbi:MAG: dephospho-CoA kinase [Chloroflexi bacterium CG15_BIG_FIL_POST_REV_8_21_14_020_46_15]|nr:MAG: dephospho-CoA kinase [Chloroflexi bacterium CG15_BIG_FIL_POST_REV_8_21_14_020_46_15]
MVVIGVTGNIGSGKSTVCRFLAELGAAVIDADKAAQGVYKPHSQAWQKIIDIFGTEVLRPSGEINRVKLAQLVFSNPKALAQLNEIVHPEAYQVVKERIENYRRLGTKVVALEAALLIEANWTTLVDKVWLVTASPETLLRRLTRGQKADRDEILARLKSQTPDEKKMKSADEVICNEGDINELQEKIVELWNKLT